MDSKFLLGNNGFFSRKFVELGLLLSELLLKLALIVLHLLEFLIFQSSQFLLVKIHVLLLFVGEFCEQILHKRVWQVGVENLALFVHVHV